MSDEGQDFYDTEEEEESLSMDSSEFRMEYRHRSCNIGMQHKLEWPSRIAQWLPDVVPVADEDYSLQWLMMGSHTPLHERSQLLIASIEIPNEMPISCVSAGFNSCKINITKKINHLGEVTMASYMPQNPCIIATRTFSSDILVFDRTLQPSEPDPSGTCSPELILRGHEEKGYGLSWNGYQHGHLLSASDDHTVCLWDINCTPSEGRVLDTITIFADHTSNVNDVQWCPDDAYMFCSVADDKKIILWDTRSNITSNIVHAHDAKVNSLSFNPNREFILATASADESIALWDIRFLKSKLIALKYNNTEFFQVQWSPHYESVLASRAADNRLFVWDMNNYVPSIAEADEYRTELSFIYYGNESNISDFSWNDNELWTFCSVAEDNILRVWQNTQ
ncbi:hypothetical protein ACJMK2_015249 [Sinanodonta woodiana]|uniref:Histone-binding protein RBBP4-like N-terminal domain-containing protein n=1 Tax=Sinanodonta woodiana TaxID=1069815 RepID=A0ABD3V5P0_SINWO